MKRGFRSSSRSKTRRWSRSCSPVMRSICRSSWHKVESTARFNVLVNYWWDAFRSGPDAPYTSMLLSMITIAERPAAERQAWKAFFDHYVFRSHGHPLVHLPTEQHGILGSLKENYGKIRARVMHLLRGG